MALTTLNFVVTTLVVSALAQWLTTLDFLSSLVLDTILGRTSSAVVTTLARQVTILPQTATTLVMESAFSDGYTLEREDNYLCHVLKDMEETVY